VRAAVDLAAAALEEAGVTVENGHAPAFSFAECYTNYCTLLNAIISADFPEKVRARLVERAKTVPGYDRSYDAVQARGAALTYMQWLEIEQSRVAIKRAWADFFETFDAMLCPAASVAAFAHDHTKNPGKRTIRVNGAEAPYFDLMHWAAPATFAHLPALVAPADLTPEGLPVGVQVIGPYLGDRKLIRIARLLEKHLRGFEAPAGFD
jgi:amidase